MGYSQVPVLQSSCSQQVTQPSSALRYLGREQLLWSCFQMPLANSYTVTCIAASVYNYQSYTIRHHIKATT